MEKLDSETGHNCTSECRDLPWNHLTHLFVAAGQEAAKWRGGKMIGKERTEAMDKAADELVERFAKALAHHETPIKFVKAVMRVQGPAT